VDQLRFRSRRKLNQNDACEVVDSGSIRQPSRRPQPPLASHATPSSFDRRNGIVLDPGAIDDPAKPSADRQDLDDQAAEAESPFVRSFSEPNGSDPRIVRWAGSLNGFTPAPVRFSTARNRKPGLTPYMISVLTGSGIIGFNRVAMRHGLGWGDRRETANRWTTASFRRRRMDPP